MINLLVGVTIQVAVENTDIGVSVEVAVAESEVEVTVGVAIEHTGIAVAVGVAVEDADVAVTVRLPLKKPVLALPLPLPFAIPTLPLPLPLPLPTEIAKACELTNPERSAAQMIAFTLNMINSSKTKFDALTSARRVICFFARSIAASCPFGRNPRMPV